MGNLRCNFHLFCAVLKLCAQEKELINQERERN